MAAALPAHSFLELALPSSASDAASSLCSEAPPSPADWCAGLGAACRGCAAAFRHTRSAYTELRQDQLDALNRRVQLAEAEEERRQEKLQQVLTPRGTHRE